MTPDDLPPLIGQQLAKRREELDLTQELLARSIGITSTTVSTSERGRTVISRAKRPLWEQALQLKAGTISRAYRDGTPIELLDVPAEAEPAPYADMSDRLERAVWEMNLDEADRRDLVDMLRKDKAERQGRRDSA